MALLRNYAALLRSGRLRMLPALLLALALALLFSLLHDHGTLRALDYHWLDLLTRRFAEARPPDPRIALVRISDGTQKSLGVHNPMPRELYSAYLKKVKALGASAQIIDIFFMPSIYRAGEEKMMKTALEVGDVVYGVKQLDRGEIMEPLEGRMSSDRFLLGHPEIYKYGGIVRGLPVLLRSSGREYYSMELKALACYRGVKLALREDWPGSGRPWYLPPGKVLLAGDSVYYPVTSGPYDLLYLSWHRLPAGAAVPWYDFEDVLQDKLPAGAFKGKIVILGDTDRLAHDIHLTPLKREYGTYLQGVVLKNLLDNDLLYPLHPGILAALCLAMGLLAFGAVASMKPLASFSATLLAGGCLLAASRYLFSMRLFLEVAPPLLTLAGSYVTVALLKSRQMEREKRYIKETFSKYAPREIVEKLLEDCGKLRLEGDRQEVTILFADIVGFTPLAERQSPEETIAMLNEYFRRMTGIIFRHGGLIKQFVGDEIMVIFGALMHREDHASRAFTTALEMREEIRRLREERQSAGKPGFDSKFGLNSGVVVLGNIGSDERMEYGAVGDVVNTASRIMGLNRDKTLGIATFILAGERTVELAGAGFAVRSLGSFNLKGKQQSIQVFEVQEPGAP